MRGPINAILGAAEEVLSTRLPRGHEEQLGLIKNAADALLGILNEQVDFARARAGELRFEEIAFSLAESVAVAVRQVTPDARRKGLPIHVHISPSAPPLLTGDPYRLRQILVKLLGNAVRFTTTGEVHLRIEETGSETDHTVLRFAIEDCGTGMVADQIREILLAGDQSVFDPNTGVLRGLVACQIMIARLGGQLEILSRPGEGSTFLFNARFSRARSAPSQIRGAQLENLPVLVVSGHLQRRSQLAATLAGWNMQPETATSAAKALSHLEAAHRRGTPFQAVIIDEQLGEDSAFAFAEQLQRRPELAPPVRILAVTAGQRGDADRCRQLGIQAYLSNPIQPLDILDALMLSLGAPTADRALITRHSLRERRHTLQVLVVGGSPVHQAQTVVLLEKLGHSPTAVRDAPEAREACAGAHFDTILLDLDEVGGPGTGSGTRHALDLGLPSHQATPPLIGLHTPGGAIPNGADWAGLTLLLTKPIRPAELAAGLAGLESRPAGDPAPHPTSDAPLDLEKLRWSLGDDEEMLRELLATYLTDAARLRQDLAAARTSGDLRTYRENLQALRGMISSLMAGPAVLALRRLEAACDSGATTEIPDAADQLDRELDRLNTALTQLGEAPKE
ncbi:MAG: hypothetical protein JNJ44_10325 [Zoogloeaceae bacterium]|nr:hypothetical protein [Zoogloeaceae bacterium]